MTTIGDSEKPARRAAAALAWHAAVPRPPAEDPPTDLPEPPIDAAWAERPILVHLAELAARQPGLAALSDGARRIDFATLHAAACRLGDALARQAAWPAGAIGVLLPNDARYQVAMMGVLAAGRPCMMLGPHLPAAALARAIAAARLSGVVSVAELAPLLPAGLPWLDFDAVADTPAPPPPRLLDPAAPAFIVATSGSTGAPKAMVQVQRVMLANYIPRIRLLRLGPHDRVAIAGPPATGGALSHRNCALLAGAGLLLLDIPRLGLGGALAEMRAQGATVLHTTPQLLKALARPPGAAAAFARLRLVMVGGDEMLRADLAAIRSVLPAGCRVHFGLSLTESARLASWYVPPDDNHDPMRVAVGYLVEGVRAALLDEDGRPAAPGAPGELVVSTPYAASGDWVDGQVLPARFTPDPADPSRRIFHTGDIVRIAEDGVMVVLGRRDRMVKLAGQRVEPAAIELAMRAVPGVADAAVLVLRADGIVRLAGFVVPAGANDADLLARVRAALRGGLPAAMVPSLLRTVAAVPLTDGGKRDDAALAAIAAAPA